MTPRNIPPAGSFTAAPKEGGAALIITLGVLVLMAIMVVSLSDLMRIERGSARSHVEKTRAELLAQNGIEEVVAALQKNTADPNRNWISQPGQLVLTPGTGTAAQNTLVPLSSGLPTAAMLDPNFTPAYFQPVNLNVATFEPDPDTTGPTYLIDPPTPDSTNPSGPGTPVKMMLNWIYVRKDGTHDPTAQPQVETTNPIVGRYAYWADDESSKVNYNLAWTRNSKNPTQPSHPSKVNLPTLLNRNETQADAIHLYQASPFPTTLAIPGTVVAYDKLNRFFFSTPEEARQVESAPGGAGVYAALEAAKFNVTHYNHDPDTTFFNQQRIALTTFKSRAGNRPFLDIGNSDNLDLGDLSNISSSKLTTVINLLNSYLQRTDWPIAPGASFQSKYYAGATNRLTQLSLNIIDYVRSKESSQPIVVPLRGTYLSNVFSIVIGTDPNSYIGTTRAPRITEMGVFVPPTPISAQSPKTYTAQVKVEVYLPKNFGVASFDLTKLSLFLDMYLDDGASTSQPLHAISAAESTVLASEVSFVPPRVGDTVMKPGERAVITRKVNINYSTGRPAAQSTALFRFAIGLVGAPGISNRLDVTPLLGSTSDYAVCKVNAPAVAIAQMPSIEVDDPRVNSHKNDWKQVAQNTFGAVNSISTLGAVATGAIVPEQDVDKNGMITDISLVMPDPAGTTDSTLCTNPSGIMASVGELGYISTGMQSAGMAGTPWRTLHLRPSKQPVTVLPDWAFMDLFTVPADVPPPAAGKPNPQALYTPHGTATGGRVNMNAKPVPFTLNRTLPLQAVFEGAQSDATNLTTVLSTAQAQTIAQNVYNMVPATGGKQYGYQTGYDSPGEVVEMKGVADGGEESEELVRSIANLITARGNVFSVYTVGQAIRQAPTGQLVVTGEYRQQAMIERYAAPPANTSNPISPTNPSVVKFRPVYFRNLTP